MVLFGDSHALSWFPALQRMAERDGWRLIVLTKSACQAGDFLQWNRNFKRAYHECTAWRADALQRIEAERPDMIVVSSSRSFQAADERGEQLGPEDRAQAWRAGMARTLGRLRAAADRVVLIADTPLSPVNPAECLSENLDSILACATPVDVAIDPSWIAEERTAASAAGAEFVDATAWVCPSAPCPPVLGRFLVLRDGGHLSTYFAAALAGRLGAEIERVTGIR